MGKLDMRDLTFVFPLRVDSKIRLENAEIVITYLQERVNSNFILMEADSIQRAANIEQNKNIRYIYSKDNNNYFHHTHYRNEMIKIATTPIIAVWDIDVLMPISQLVKAVEKIRNEEAVMSFPYDGPCFSIPEKESQDFRKNRNEKILFQSKYELMYGLLSVGGTFLVNRIEYMKSGMENEYFYGWGMEDTERLKRISTLGLPVFRVPGAIYHLWHPRGMSSRYYNMELTIANTQHFLKICAFTKEELIEEISTWSWIDKNS